MKKSIILALAALWVTSGAAQVYRCEGEKGPVFSQTPCAHDAAPVDLEMARPSATEEAAARARAAQHQELAEQARLERRADIRAQATAQRIVYLERERDARLANLAARRARANNNLAGATLQQALAIDEQAIRDDYARQIEAIRQQTTP